jgi:pimeloyl-ACP methyl ester carboxylesterase
MIQSGIVNSRPDHVPEDPARFWRTPAGVRRVLTGGRHGRVHYRIAAPAAPSRPPLLCFHLTPNSGRLYANLLAAMGTDRIAVAPDTPGFGLSDPPAAAPTVDELAACMGELAEELGTAHGFERFDVMGFHTGSKIALALARQRPAQVRRIVLVSAPVYSEDELRRQRETLAVPPPDIWDADGKGLRRRWLDHWQWRDPLAPAWFMQREIAEGLASIEHAPRTYRAVFEVRHADELPRATQPVLLLCPGDDLEIPTKRAEPLLRNGRFVPLPGWSHGFLDVRTDEAAALLREFLDAPDVGASAEAGSEASRGEARAPRPPHAPKPGPRRAAVRHAFHDGPHGPLYYRIVEPAAPERVPLLLLHMSPNSGRIYDALLPAMGRDRVVVAPDTPGFGESEAPATPPAIEDYATAMAGLVDALGLRQVDVMGYHTGAITAVVTALARPDLVRRIVMVSCPVFTDEELAGFRADHRAREPREDGSHLVEAWTFLQRFYGPGVPRSVLARNFTAGLRGGPFAHWGHRAAFAHDLRPDLPKLTQPVLVLNPDDDLAVQTPRGLPLLRNARQIDLPGGHGFLDTMTDAVAVMLREFLDAP